MSRLDAVFLSAFLYFISFPFAFNTPNLIPGALSATAVWFAFVPLLVALRKALPGESFRWTYLFGFLANAGVFFWVIIAIKKYGGLSIWVSGTILLLLILALALYPAVSLWATARFRPRAPFWLAGPLFFTLLDWIRVYFPLQGFPWATPAYSLSGSLPLVQSADLVGTMGLNLLVFGTNFALAEVIVRWRGKRSFPRILVSAAAFLFVFSASYGFYRLHPTAPPDPSVQKIRIALLQGNIPQDLKWNPDLRNQILSDYGKLTAAVRDSNPDLVVWPEAALPITLPRDIQSLPFLAGLTGGPDLLAGAATAFTRDNTTFFQNSAFVVEADGNVRLRYDKQHLVPYGEYVPFSDILPMEYIVPPVAGNFSPGSTPPLAEIHGHRYGILICYEALFPDLTLDFVRRGAGFLVNITNDAWFDRTSGPYQHVRFGILRAIETRRPVVRAANTGISTWFDPQGRMHTPTGLFKRGYVIADVAPQDRFTFYTRHPRLIPILTLLLLLICSLRVFGSDEN